MDAPCKRRRPGSEKHRPRGWPAADLGLTTENMGEAAELPLVLVVDDDEDHCMMLEVALETRGHRVLTAHSARSALETMRAHTVDALVCDLTLGDGTALDVLRDIGERRPPVAVVLSGFDDTEDRERSIAAGFDAHLVKPTPVETLIDVIARGLGRPRSGIQLTETAASPRAPAKKSHGA